MVRSKARKDPRRALLAKVHIAKKELGIDDEVYRTILREEFGVDSSGLLNVRELERLVARFEGRGWQSRPSNGAGEARVLALRERAASIMQEAGIDGRRGRGLVQKICGVADLRFCRDAAKLKRLLAALGKITSYEGRSKP